MSALVSHPGEWTVANMRNASTDLDRALAGYLISLQEGDQLLSTRELAERFDSSLGSISAAINQFEELGAVTINRRGRLGSFLEQKSIGALWGVFENGPMVIALTLPSFLKCEGLATALYTVLNNAGIETYLIFIRGSLNRVKALRHRQCHATVISALAADELCGVDEQIVMTLPPRSFVEDHRVFYRHDHVVGSRPLVVGYDPDSFDVKYLTELEFADREVRFQPMTFTQIDLHLEDSSVDAAITNGDFMERLTAKGFHSEPISPRVTALVGERYTSATLVVPAGAGVTRTVLQELLDPQQVLAIQQQVVSGLIVPRY
mgnify:CR=1 FL=1